MSDYLRDPDPVDEISQHSGRDAPGRSLTRPAVTRGAKLTALTTALAVVLTGGIVTAPRRAFPPRDAPGALVAPPAVALRQLGPHNPSGPAGGHPGISRHF